jgi:hypothetical protein
LALHSAMWNDDNNLTATTVCIRGMLRRQRRELGSRPVVDALVAVPPFLVQLLDIVLKGEVWVCSLNVSSDLVLLLVLRIYEVGRHIFFKKKKTVTHSNGATVQE